MRFGSAMAVRHRAAADMPDMRQPQLSRRRWVALVALMLLPAVCIAALQCG